MKTMMLSGFLLAVTTFGGFGLASAAPAAANCCNGSQCCDNCPACCENGCDAGCCGTECCGNGPSCCK